MKKVVLLFLLFQAVNLYGQQKNFSYSFSGTDYSTIFNKIENDTGLKIYYQPDWFENSNYSGDLSASSVKELMTQLLSTLDLNIFVNNEIIVITKSVKIIDKPEILNQLSGNTKNQQKIATGLLFTRDNNNNVTINDNPESLTYEIGDRSKFSNNEKSSIVGYVKEKSSKKPIEGVLAYSEDLKYSGSTDENGFYSLTIPNGKNKILFQYLSMKPTTRKIILFSDGQLNVGMEDDIIKLNEIIVESNKDDNVQEVSMGISKIDAKDTKSVPVILGENDIIKVATTYAGVQSVGEGASGINVRGGKSDQNLILLDGVTIYNANHFFGFFSSFNADAISSLEIYKSSAPVEFGGRLSSVFDIKSKKSSLDKFQLKAGFSPVTSKVTVEIPILKGKSGLMLGGRTTYSNWILQQVKDVNFRENKASFSDLTFRYDHQLNPQNELTLSGYLSKDQFRLSSDTLFSFSDFSYTNSVASVKWKRNFTNKLDGTVNFHLSRYGYDLVNDESEDNAFKQDFGINELFWQSKLDYYKTEGNIFTGGIGFKLYDINPGSIKPLGSESQVQSKSVGNDRGLESFLFLSNTHDFSKRLSITAGLRYSAFQAFGPRTVLAYDPGQARNSDSVTDTLTFNRGETIKTYHGPEYRFSFRYTINQATSIKLAANRNRQYLNSLSNAASLSPTDIWTLSGFHLKPQISDQVSLGLFRNISENKYETSIEGYYKKLQNLVDFKTGENFLLNSQIETAVLQGDGKSYGIELSVKKSGRLNGYINYTFARTFIKLDGIVTEETINDGDFFPTNYDKPHTVNLVMNYKFTERLSFSLNSNYQTGRPVTFPTGLYSFKGSELVSYGKRNTFRIPNYFRVDLGINLDESHKIDKLYHTFWSFSIYNLLGRDNPYSVFFDVREAQVEGFQLIIFGNPVPTISFNLRF